MASNTYNPERHLNNNKEFVKTYKNPFVMKDVRDVLVANNNGVVILTCLDPRCVPEQFFGPNLGAGCVRNAGGRATKDAINSITVLRALVGIKTVLVIHHTDCGMSYMGEDALRAEVKARSPEAGSEIDAVESFGCFDKVDLEKSVRDDVETLRQAKALAGMEFRGFKFTTETGVVTEID